MKGLKITTINSILSKVVLNIVAALVSGLFLFFLFQHHETADGKISEKYFNKGYDWLLTEMILPNVEFIKSNGQLNTAERYEAKWGGEISLINQITKVTPEYAVILLPPRKILSEAGFKNGVIKAWITYFLYPRTIVFEDDKVNSKFYPVADFLVSVNGWGLDKLKYKIKKPEKFMVLSLAARKNFDYNNPIIHLIR